MGTATGIGSSSGTVEAVGLSNGLGLSLGPLVGMVTERVRDGSPPSQPHPV